TRSHCLHLRQCERSSHPAGAGHRPGPRRAQSHARMRYLLRRLPARVASHDRTRKPEGRLNTMKATTPYRPAAGKVWLVGAGPGDPEQLTLKALRILTASTLWLVDDLVGEGVLALASPGTRMIKV